MTFSSKLFHLQRVSIIALFYSEDCSTKYMATQHNCNSHARIEIAISIFFYKHAGVLIGQFDLMKSYSYVGIFVAVKLATNLIGNFSCANNKRAGTYVFFSKPISISIFAHLFFTLKLDTLYFMQYALVYIKLIETSSHKFVSIF